RLVGGVEHLVLRDGGGHVGVVEQRKGFLKLQLLVGSFGLPALDVLLAGAHNAVGGGDALGVGVDCGGRHLDAAGVVVQQCVAQLDERGEQSLRFDGVDIVAVDGVGGGRGRGFEDAQVGGGR